MLMSNFMNESKNICHAVAFAINIKVLMS